ncbi:hypothetical protein WSS_A34687 [Rhodococcus opacus M213]|uniref:Uncharacterized protein n=1 Tax=Rhodococcus opacus M213 TaxID=1129896 RepID=K8XLW4_RHOOP|nr:hypothetical protein [Rhodococcus opacus]EKT78020.1 hypothetical protein WSS_A34687 [Rhodococcus opacus M213]
MIYESRLELARLLFADFEMGVQRIAAQPFLSRCPVDGKERRHIPDYLPMTTAGRVIAHTSSAVGLEDGGIHIRVDQVGVARAGMALRGVERATTDRAGECSVPCRLSEGVVVRSDALGAVRSAVREGITIGEALSAVVSYPEPSVRTALLHLLWRQGFRVDLAQRLTAASMLRTAS